jgi:nucleotide-binding universal stress UspA family protein
VGEVTDGVDGIALIILAEAQNSGFSSLISAGSRGCLGRISRARIGSVSTKVVRAADGPILIHPREA